MKQIKYISLSGGIAFALLLTLAAFPAYAQEMETAARDMEPAGTAQVDPGQDMKLEGVIVARQSDQMTVRSHQGLEYKVVVNPQTEIREKKSNPFRGAKQFAQDELLLGLNVAVEGIGNDSGMLVAEKIKMTQSDLKVAQTITSRVDPVERSLDETRQRVSASEREAQRLSGEVEELESAFSVTREEAAAAQQTANEAVQGVGTTNERITSLDDYEEAQSVTLTFRFDSAELSDEAKGQLDGMATRAREQKGYLIEVMGFASADGDEVYNRRLSQQRAESVMRYLAAQHDIPLRRIVTPIGLGEDKPVAQNDTREGRQQNRRVEVRMLVNRGLTDTAQIASLPSTDNQ